MMKLYRKSEITFAVLWIIAYVVLSSVADQISESLGTAKSVTAVLQIGMSAVLLSWILRNGLSRKYGLCRPSLPARWFLYYLPLVLVASAALWGGISMRFGTAETVCWIVSMCCVGFLEEMIFRGLLFRAMEKNSLKAAVIVSSVTFGIGHIVNLFNGSGQGIADTFSQIVFAVMVGFVLVTVFRFGGSLLPCIVFHALNNALSAFGREGVFSSRTELLVSLALTVFVLGGYLLYLYKAFSDKKDSLS